MYARYLYQIQAFRCFILIGRFQSDHNFTSIKLIGPAEVFTSRLFDPISNGLFVNVASESSKTGSKKER